MKTHFHWKLLKKKENSIFPCVYQRGNAAHFVECVSFFMTTQSNTLVRRIFNNRDEHISDLTAAFYELEPYDSITHALEWKQIKRRLPICFKKTLKNRFMLPNLMYLGYAIVLLVIDFDENFNPPSNSTLIEWAAKKSNSNQTVGSVLDQPVQNDPLTNKLYIGKSFVID